MEISQAQRQESILLYINRRLDSFKIYPAEVGKNKNSLINEAKCHNFIRFGYGWGL
jgi:hypothetical protein